MDRGRSNDPSLAPVSRNPSRRLTPRLTSSQSFPIRAGSSQPMQRVPSKRAPLLSPNASPRESMSRGVSPARGTSPMTASPGTPHELLAYVPQVRGAMATSLLAGVERAVHAVSQQVVDGTLSVGLDGIKELAPCSCEVGFFSNEQVISNLLHLVVNLALFPKPWRPEVSTQTENDVKDVAVQEAPSVETFGTQVDMNAVEHEPKDSQTQTECLGEDAECQAVVERSDVACAAIAKVRDSTMQAQPPAVEAYVQAAAATEETAVQAELSEEMPEEVDRLMDDVEELNNTNWELRQRMRRISLEQVPPVQKVDACTQAEPPLLRDASLQALVESIDDAAEPTPVQAPVQVAAARGVRIGGGYDVLRLSLPSCIPETVRALSPHRILAAEEEQEGLPERHVGHKHGAPSQLVASGRYGVGLYSSVAAETKTGCDPRLVAQRVDMQSPREDVRLYRVLVPTRESPVEHFPPRRPKSALAAVGGGAQADPTARRRPPSRGLNGRPRPQSGPGPRGKLPVAQPPSAPAVPMSSAIPASGQSAIDGMGGRDVRPEAPEVLAASACPASAVTTTAFPLLTAFGCAPVPQPRWGEVDPLTAAAAAALAQPMRLAEAG